MNTIVVYIRLLKPRETLLLAIIGLCTAVIAGQGSPPIDRFLLAAITIIIGSGGTNGLTNYLDRHVDAKMKRTRHRVIPSGLITPTHALIWASTLVATGLLLAPYLHPYAFIAGISGVTAGLIFRKTWATHFLGILSSCGPLIVGWFAINPNITPTIALLCLIILLWLPIHVWNLMISARDDYLEAGVNIFPLNRGVDLTAKVSLILSIILFGTCMLLYMAGDFGGIYLGSSLIGCSMMVWATFNMLRSKDKDAAYRAFKASAFPFLLLIFVAPCIDLWIAGLS